MKRWVIAIAAVIAVLLLPEGQGTDVGKLQPVELLYIYINDGKIILQTDTGDTGMGYTLDAAVDDMHNTASGVVFLDTIDYVLLTENTRDIINDLQNILRPSTNILIATGTVDPEKVTEFLKIHKPDVSLKNYMAGQKKLPKLMTAEGRYYIA